MARPTPQAPIELEAPPPPPPPPPASAHMAPQFAGQPYLSPTAASPPGPASYGGMGYHYPHFPHTGGVDPYHTHPNDHYGTPMATPPQSRPPDPYTFPMPPRPNIDAAAAVGEGARKRAAEEMAAVTIKRARPDETVTAAD